MRVRPMPVAAALSFVAISALVMNGSSAAFTSSTENTGNSWTAGTVLLEDDDNNSALFTSGPLAPGDAEENCITVTYQGTAPDAPVKLYASASGDLAPYLDVVVQRGTGGGFGSCSGFTATESLFTGTLAQLATTHPDYANGAGTWQAAPAESSVYRFAVTFRADADNAAQGKQADATFTWETQVG